MWIEVYINTIKLFNITKNMKNKFFLSHLIHILNITTTHENIEYRK